MEVDSLLAGVLSSSSDDDADKIEISSSAHRRTVEEILLPSSSCSSSSSSSPSSSRSPSPTKSATPSNLPDSQILVEEYQQITSTSSSSSALRRRTSGEILHSSQPLGLRAKTTASLPPLFGGFRPRTRKPGAALAAASAASRFVPTPHAVAIKLKRAVTDGNFEDETGGPGLVRCSSEETVDSADSGSGSGQRVRNLGTSDGDFVLQSSHLSNENDEVLGESQVSDSESAEESVPSSRFSDNNRGIEHGDSQGIQVEACSVIADHEDGSPPIRQEVIDNSERLNATLMNLSGSLERGEENATIYDDNLSVFVKERSHCSLSQSPTSLSSLSTPPIIYEDAHKLDAEESFKLEEVHRDTHTQDSIPHDEEAAAVGENDIQNNEKTDDSSDLVDERKEKSGGAMKYSRRAEKMLRGSMKPLEWAEEIEKRQASYGIHCQEGAMAQPMRLEGIRREPPAVGYLQIDFDNTITRAISSQMFRHEHGMPQVVTAHMNFIAIGTSKGIVLVAPSKYTPYSIDNMDLKMLLLGSEGDKSSSPVTSMCFNQQGDLLLVGYGDGHLTIWDMQKATAAKVITGEHASPVIHTAFLGQDSQLTRQFRAITGDSKGVLKLHAISVVPLLFRFSIKTQPLLDGKRTGTALSVSPLLMDALYLGSLAPAQGYSAVSTGGIGSIVGGVVGGVVGGETGWKLFNDESPPIEGVVIIVSSQNAIVVRLTAPSFQVFRKLNKPDGIREGSIPYTAWKHGRVSRGLSTEHATASDCTSWLVIAWDRKILVFKLVNSELIDHMEWSLESEAIAVAWLDEQILVSLTSKGNFCLFSRDGLELHRTNLFLKGITDDELIAYHTHFTNSFGNPEKAYHNSVAVRGATIYVLGPSHLIISRLLPWKERIQVLQRAGDWMGALDMSMRLYDGHTHGVVDLPREVDAIREIIMPYLVELLLSYVDEVFSYISVAFCNQIGKHNKMDDCNSKSDSAHTEMEEQFVRVGGVAVEFCVHIKRMDVLFDVIFSRFVAVQHGGTFLENLEPYILKDMLGSLPPEIMQSLVEHYSRKGWLQRVEQCVLHMDISSLDFNQVVKLCREHGLYGALIYLFNKGLDDYRTPLEELLVVVQNLARRDAAGTGYRMLVYLKYCFLGLAFPPGQGSISVSRLPTLREELLLFLLEDSVILNSPVVKTFRSSCGACLNLFYLLWFDLEATLEVLRCAFLSAANALSDCKFEDKGGLTLSMKTDIPCENHGLRNMTQNMVNCLIACFGMESNAIRYFKMEDGEVWPSTKGIDLVIEFVVLFVTYKLATISEMVFKHIMHYLASSDHSSEVTRQKAEAYRKEKMLLSLLDAIPASDWNMQYVLDICLKVQFYQACGVIYTIKEEYVDALDSYMKDLGEPAHAFAFIHKMLLHFEDADRSSFRMAVISRLPDLVRLSREGAFFLVIDKFNEDIQDILSSLQSNQQSLFLFIKTAFEMHSHVTLDFSSLRSCRTFDFLFGTTIKNDSADLAVYLEVVSNFPKVLHLNPIPITDEVIELYLELLCQYERSSVWKFLETFENYRLEHCLRLCQQYGIIDASAFLLERAGDVSGAFALTVDDLHKKLEMLSSSVQCEVSTLVTRGSSNTEHITNIMQTNEFTMICDAMHALIGLCQRNTMRLDPKESESLWLWLLETLCKPLRELCIDKDVSEGRNNCTIAPSEKLSKTNKGELNKATSILKRLFSHLIGEVVEGMIGYVPLPIVMENLLSDNGNKEFGDFKSTILGMLATYGFEKRILDTAKSLIEDDTFCTMSLLKKEVSHAYSPQSFVCCICGGSFTKETSSSGIRIFNCGHANHLHCEFQENESPEKLGLVECVVCMPKRKTRHPRSKAVLVDNGLIRSSTSRRQSRQGGKELHSHEYEQLEKPYGLQHISRFEILSNLQKSRKSPQIDIQPLLRLAPPAVYHEKVQKGNIILGKNSQSSVKNERSRKSKHHTIQPKQGGFSKRLSLGSSIFGSEKSKYATITKLESLSTLRDI